MDLCYLQLKVDMLSGCTLVPSCLKQASNRQRITNYTALELQKRCLINSTFLILQVSIIIWYHPDLTSPMYMGHHNRQCSNSLMCTIQIHTQKVWRHVLLKLWCNRLPIIHYIIAELIFSAHTLHVNYIHVTGWSSLPFYMYNAAHYDGSSTLVSHPSQTSIIKNKMIEWKSSYTGWHQRIGSVIWHRIEKVCQLMMMPSSC